MENTLHESTVAALLKRGNMALGDNDFRQAKRCFNQALNIEPELGAAYIGLAMASARTPNKKEFLWYCVEQRGKDNRNLRHAREFAIGEWTEFFEDVDKEIAQKEQEKAELAKMMKKTAIIIAVIGLFVIALYLMLPHIIYAPAEQLYKDGQYEQAYKKAADISQNGLGSLFENKVEKYTYTYLINYLEEGDKELQISMDGGGIVSVSSYAGHGVLIACDVKTDKCSVRWMIPLYDGIEEEHISLVESRSGKSCSIMHGDFEKSKYTDGQSIDNFRANGLSHYISSQSAFRNTGERIINKGLWLIGWKLGIKPEHLGFDSYKQ